VLLTVITVPIDCDNTATNSNSENARSRMVASLRGSVGTGTKEDESSIARSKREGTRAETRFGLPAKRTSPFKSAGVSVQSTTGSQGDGSADSNCIDRDPTYSARLLATHSIRIFPLHFPSRASPCAIRF